MSKISFLLIIPFLFILGSCNRKASSSIDKPDEVAGFQQMLDRFQRKVIDPEWFFSKADVKLDLEQFNTTVTAKILLQTDQRALISVKKFGAEIMRAFASPDSVILVDRFRKKYFFAEGEEIKNMNLPFTFESLQSLFLGNPYHQTIDDYSMNDTGASFKSYIEPYVLNYFFDEQFYLRTCVFESEDQSQKIESKLNDYIEVSSDKIFSNQRDISWTSDGKTQGSASLEFKSIELDVPREFKISIPSSYEKMEF